MNNYFITKPPYASAPGKLAPLIKFINKGLRYLDTGYQIQELDNQVDMNTVEQRINYYHLLTNVINTGVEGDVVELGTFTGQCAALFGKVITDSGSKVQLHVYDSFGVSFKFKGDIENKLKENFTSAGLPLPLIHKGNFFDTLPIELPEKLCFVHIDCGFGGNAEEHKEVMLHCLNSVYPRMSPGALCVLMDYNDPAENGIMPNIAPGVKMACDEFLTNKPETITALYGNSYLHAYFRKV
ncbi:hypothetical protein FPZ42_09225 [Mucilaginibacter achroorhodeus]|uniref:Class I SAM-dependent methyltransferase n=1 Tax=Mucilaginibacter achroorhodeus TaxID=2599294 RepID=A0A563U778_9SPHI|nr:hypothetical protein [Mucilaginibacter achroorhodeus]TWR27198.1 hypothetical protein FPZ42_09225 [Mucilaginibacter achroorhodeus]